MSHYYYLLFRDMPKAILECRENESLVNFVSDALRDHGDHVGHFELNLETWRQLWRVVEMSDVLLLVVDSRYPVRMTLLISVAVELHIIGKQGPGLRYLRRAIWRG